MVHIDSRIIIVYCSGRVDCVPEPPVIAVAVGAAVIRLIVVTLVVMTLLVVVMTLVTTAAEDTEMVDEGAIM